jgi:hypothetical protein
MQVISVDRTVDPPSYCVQVDGRERETEGWRLRSISNSPPAVTEEAEAPQAVTDADNADNPDFEGDFGDFVDAENDGKEEQHPLESIEVAPALVFETPLETSRRGDIHEDGSVTAGATEQSAEVRFPSNAVEESIGQLMPEPSAADSLEFADFKTAEDDGPSAATSSGHQELPMAPPAPIKTVSASNSPGVGAPSSSLGALAPTGFATPLSGHLGRTTSASPAHFQPSPTTTEYGIAWLHLLQAAADRLQLGRALWDEAVAARVAGRLLAEARARRFYAAMGEVYLSARTVRVAAAELGLYGIMDDLKTAWEACHRAWEAAAEAENEEEKEERESEREDVEFLRQRQGEPDSEYKAKANEVAEASCPGLLLKDAALLVGGERLAHRLATAEAGAAVVARLGMDDFPRMLIWSEGLDGMTLLPLSVVGEWLPVATWGAKGRPTGASLANLWSGAVSPVEPDLE